MSNEQAPDGLSIEQVEDEVWGAPPPDATKLMTTVYDLRRKPLRELAPEDLRVLIAQKVGLEVLIPRAIDLFAHDPLVEGDYYPGDVLVAVLKAPPGYWSAHPAERARLERIIADLGEDAADLRKDIDAFQSSSR
ncbi:MAG TPA: contact-dependent growth inhibition system immunity protein [Candidatus Limnocylindrales bacterium]|nr:contact-dependent growth inhibition system immunity protein [Candidatus Limnocylindrales bacterium]